MKLRVLLLVAIFGFMHTLYAQCLDENEKKKLIDTIQYVDEFYVDVPNYIQCDKNQTSLEKLVCQDPDYLQMFRLLSQANVYVSENAIGSEVNHRDFNKKNMKYWKTSFDSEPINVDHLCFELKEDTNSKLYNAGLFPYKMGKLSGKYVYFLQENKHGVVVTDRDGYKVYMGKNCDVVDSKKQTGRWYNDETYYVIEIGDTKIDFIADELRIENVKCKM